MSRNSRWRCVSESGDGVSIYPGTQDWQDLRAMYDNSSDFGDSFVGGLLNDLQISIRRALDASMPKIAACAAGKAIATAANVAMHLQNGYSVETMGGTTVVGLNSGARFGDYKLGAMGSFLYIQSAEETAICTAVTGNIGSSGRSLGGLPSVSTSSSLGATTASLDTFMSGDGYGLGRGFRGFVGVSGGVIKDNQENFHPLVNLELGVGTAQEISTGVYSDFESCS
ncbi:hypothetical protein DES40_1207 [Litorimonas taeanensis]|uniref:Uncharacterized protein n=1 Tax=Litorimonas taeanensis TaxID=568099 RepID=A0A420WLW5_9PROT|nr:hypothetical protein [Litorimonas taeanensis]RKQ71875.1 hypothetical protein DES40_1207 [Litorimonas taeanensis]